MLLAAACRLEQTHLSYRTISPNAVSERIGMTWDGTDNQIQLDGQTVELSLFAGGAAAESALNLFDKGGPEDLNAFYTREIEKLYPGYTDHRFRQPQFIRWPRER